MSQLMITGYRRPQNIPKIRISGAKNAALPLMAASLLTDQEVTLKNVPAITDINVMKECLKKYGVTVHTDSCDPSSLVLHANSARAKPSGPRPTTDIRASFLVLGPLLARFGDAKVYKPGGCEIQDGGRPVDYHIKALEKMGATCEDHGDSFMFRANRGLRGANIEFPIPSVGATENVIMAACLAEGKTTIDNAAVNPDIKDLVTMLGRMGASIDIVQETKRITIRGEPGLLSGATHTVVPDRIEAGTYAIIAGITGGPLSLEMPGTTQATINDLMYPIIGKLKEAMIDVKVEDNCLKVKRREPLRPVDITTGPYPQFPTDLLPQWVTLMTQADGRSTIVDEIYNNRFAHVPELQKMGASFHAISNNHYHVHGNAKLQGKHVTCKDLRGGMALMIPALVAEGPTVVKDIQHVLRGYANLVENLKKSGAVFQELHATRPGYYGGN